MPNSELRSKYVDWYNRNLIKLEHSYLESFTKYLIDNPNYGIKYSGGDDGTKFYTIDNTFEVYTYIGSKRVYGLCPIFTQGMGTDGAEIKLPNTTFNRLIKEIKATVYTGMSKYRLSSEEGVYVYVQELKSHEGDAIKYGVAGNTKVRMKTQSDISQFSHEILYEVCLPSRKDALALERDIRSMFGGYYVEKAWMPDGYTETLSYELKDEVIDYIKSVTK